MTTLEDIAARLDQTLSRLDRIEASIGIGAVAFIRGDDEAAKLAGFRSRAAFRRWCEDEGIRPDVRGGLNFWNRARIMKGSR